MKTEQTKFGSYTINDRRGKEEMKHNPCRVCGSPKLHTSVYNSPTMDCIKYLRQRIVELEAKK